MSESKDEHFVKEKKIVWILPFLKSLFWDNDTFETMCTLKNSGVNPSYLYRESAKCCVKFFKQSEAISFSISKVKMSKGVHLQICHLKNFDIWLNWPYPNGKKFFKSNVKNFSHLDPENRKYKFEHYAKGFSTNQALKSSHLLTFRLLT